MKINLEILKPEEKAVLSLRALYESRGYQKFKVSRFEEYSFYLENKDFLAGKKIPTFTDLNGKLMALKPDVTLSIIKHSRADHQQTEKLYYIENVYRENQSASGYREISQMGLEYLGEIEGAAVGEVALLAAQSLAAFGPRAILTMGHSDFTLGVFQQAGIDLGAEPQIMAALSAKNAQELKALLQARDLPQAICERISHLALLEGDFAEVLQEAGSTIISSSAKAALKELSSVYLSVQGAGLPVKLRLDFALLNDVNYYNGIVFKGYLQGLARPVLSGGAYDKMMRKLGKKAGAIGFAIYLNELTRLDKGPQDTACAQALPLTVALPKGRLAEKVCKLLNTAGYDCGHILDEAGRRLEFFSQDKTLRFLLVKPSDVAIYVEHGAADIGIVGKDILLESAPEVYELLDLRLGRCRFCEAAPVGYRENLDRALVVATSFTNVARQYYASINREIELIKLNGSVELAPLLGLSDVIVDLVESGSTLKANKMEVSAEIMPISARLIANKSAYAFKHQAIAQLTAKLEGAIDND